VRGRHRRITPIEIGQRQAGVKIGFVTTLKGDPGG
jgi:hypothetical protein